jgi:hypothetical protein
MEGVVPESPERGEENQAEQSAADLHQDSAAADSTHPTPGDSPILSPTDGADGKRPPGPLQKRRRVTRACDGTYILLNMS